MPSHDKMFIFLCLPEGMPVFESTWLFQKLIGVSSKVIPLSLDEVSWQLLAPGEKGTYQHPSCCTLEIDTIINTMNI